MRPVSRRGHADPQRHRGPTRAEMLALLAAALAAGLALALPFGLWTW